ncbi:hypothetical protein [Nocardia sp. NPDC005745]|uniref:hypothetical protein n=1 Tax=Nocardia sp. NPDC005745 TaxID=3157061 RepID=UPI0033F847B4
MGAADALPVVIGQQAGVVKAAAALVVDRGVDRGEVVEGDGQGRADGFPVTAVGEKAQDPGDLVIVGDAAEKFGGVRRGQGDGGGQECDRDNGPQLPLLRAGNGQPQRPSLIYLVNAVAVGAPLCLLVTSLDFGGLPVPD